MQLTKKTNFTLKNLKYLSIKYPHYCVFISLGLLLRILWAVAVPVIPVSDSHAYDVFAQNLATGAGYGWNSESLTAYWAPGTSFIYALLYYIFGHSYLPIICLNLFLSALLIWGSMSLAETWFNRRVSQITGLLLACWPVLIQFTTILASEILFTVLIVVALVVWQNEENTLRSRAIWVGILLGAASYVRPTALLIPFLLFFFRCFSTREIFKTMTATLVMLILMAVLIAPWSYRNTQVFDQFVTISTNSGANFWMGNNPDSTGGYMSLPPEVKGMNEAKRNDYLKSLAKQHIKDNPALFIKRCFIRLFETHNRQSIGVAWNAKGLKERYGEWILFPIKFLNQIYWIPVILLALTGVFTLLKSHGWQLAISHPAIVMWEYYAAVHAVIVSQDRYHFPSIPLIAILAAFCLTQLIDRKTKKQKIKHE